VSVARRIALLALVALSAGCQKRRAEPAAEQRPAAAPASAPSAAPAPAAVLVAKRGTPTVDGELDQPVWHQASRTDPFVAARGKDPVPHTEARASWDDDALYFELYVADDDLRSTDHVWIELEGGRRIEASPDRKLACKFGSVSDCTVLGIRAGFDVDGDVDRDASEDEEWAVTVVVPWRTVAPKGRPRELPVSLGRDDSAEGRPVREVWGRSPGTLRFE
jgi:Carbohydrate family 9 binding domain-like